MLSAVIVYLWFYFRKYSVCVNKGAIIIKSGVIIRTERILPVPRLIYTEKFTSPFARIFGVSQLYLKAIKVNLPVAELEEEKITTILGVISNND